MLIIRNDQLQSLQLDVRVRNATSALRRALSDECEKLGEDGLRRRIELGFQKAEHYGITDLSEVIRFIELMFALGEDFDSREAARKILDWTDITNEFKLQALEKLARQW